MDPDGQPAEANSTSINRPAPWVHIGVFAALFLLTLGLQHRNGALSNDFGAHADEASHVVTGLMVRDYLAGPIWRLEHPMRFAESYYEHFPKVALGHYPPGFYTLEGLWLLPFRSKLAIVLMMTLLTSTTAFMIWLVGRRFLLPFGAILAAATFVLIPLVQTYTAIVMSDMLLVIFCLLASLTFGRFMENPSARWSLLFGLLAAAAILTKGSGLMLALVPPFAILIRRQFRLLADWRLWLAPIPVLALALPWMLATFHITDEGMQHVPFAEYLPSAIKYYSASIPDSFGWILSLLLLLSVFLSFFHRKASSNSPVGIHYTCFLSFLFSILLFYLAVPSGLDKRYLLPALPFAILLSFHLVEQFSVTAAPRLLKGADDSPSPQWISYSALILFSILISAENGMPLKKEFTGCHEALTAVATSKTVRTETGKTQRAIVLVSSDSRGEGALIAEGCLSWPEDLSFRRSSKVLSSSDWLGRDYRSTFENTSQLEEYLLKEIDFIIVDTDIPKYLQHAHHGLLETTLIEAAPGNFTKISSIDSRRRTADTAQFLIYQTDGKK